MENIAYLALYSKNVATYFISANTLLSAWVRSECSRNHSETCLDLCVPHRVALSLKGQTPSLLPAQQVLIHCHLEDDLNLYTVVI